MAEYLHKISELRNRFRYDSKTGWVFWKDVPFIEWARGNSRAKQGYYRKWKREKAGKIVRFHYVNPRVVGRLSYRTVSYTAPRLVWALHYGKHPAVDDKIIQINGDPRDLRIENLTRISKADHYRETLTKIRGAKKLQYREPQRSWLTPKRLRMWFDYNPHTGDVYWQDIGWSQWKELNRGPRADPELYEEYMYNQADTLVEFRKDKRGDQVVDLKHKVYERKLLSYALKEGDHIPDICYLYHRNGDETDFRWENIGMTYRDDIDPDAD